MANETSVTLTLMRTSASMMEVNVCNSASAIANDSFSVDATTVPVFLCTVLVQDVVPM